ncbi:hypothetical protein AB6A40_010396 [Gnathostoma spinigerum]|uniref:Uncharacterized protein n=1 Tax=Gnathostoma spinigerum TaxID=75299 RepID=A0ABD6F2D9_9BILA
MDAFCIVFFFGLIIFHSLGILVKNSSNSRMTETHSRRKQYKPARIPKLMDGTAPNANIPSLTSTSVIVKASSGVDNQCADKDGGYLQAGTILGSFPAGDLNGKKDNEVRSM